MNGEQIAYKLGFGARRRAEVSQQFRERYATVSTPAAPPQKVPLTAGQHILHLLLTVFTCGLWAPVWILRAMSGNRPQPPPPSWAPQQTYPQQWQQPPGPPPGR